MSAGNDINVSKVVYDSLIGCLILLELIIMKMLSDLKDNDSKLFEKVNRVDKDLSELRGEHKERCKK